jgi:diguanylate cyclase (GGDEF)-like protein/PAS domain S-box-containing protein
MSRVLAGISAFAVLSAAATAGPGGCPLPALLLVAIGLATLLTAAQLEPLRVSAASHARQEPLLDAVLKGIPYGLCVFGPDHRLLVANERYAQTYGLKPEQVKPGTPLQAVIDQCVANGIYAHGDPRDSCKLLDFGHRPSSKAHELSDGRVILISRQPIPGGGWVATHEDITESERLKSQIEQQNAHFQAILENMSQGVCLFDAKQRVVLANRRYAEMYGLPIELMQPGTTLRQILEARAARGFYNNDYARQWVAEGVATFKNQMSDVLPLSDGRFICVLRRPLPDGSLLSTHEDITEREQLRVRLEQQNELLKKREAELEQQNAKLDTALKMMSQGLCMFDAEGRVVLSNERYATLYGLDKEQVKPGTSIRQILEYRHAKGLFGDIDFEVFAREYLEEFGQASSRIQQLADGRVISIVRQPMPNGGLVSTTEDVTERHKLLARFKEQKEQLDLALNNMSQGLAMYDANNRLVVCNKLYYEMYGLTAEQVRPGMTIREIFEQRVANGAYTEQDVDALIRSWLSDFGDFSSRIQKLRDGRIISVSRKRTAAGGRVVTHEDITEREKLRERLDTALNTMAQGLAMFDADERIVIANARFAEMYGMTPEQVKPGTTLREIIEARVANGHYIGETVDETLQIMRQRVAQKKVLHRTNRLGDGRVIAVTIQPRADGGWVATHHDITEREQLAAQLAQQNELLKGQEEKLRLQNIHLDAALNNMVQGLAMFDSELRLLVANARFAEIYGLKPEQVTPGTTLKQIIQYRIANGDIVGKSVDEVLHSALRVAGEPVDLGHYVTQLSGGRYISVSTRRMPDGGWVTTHHDITEQKCAEAKIAHMALHDSLTGLPNRAFLSERLEQAVSRAKRGEIVATHFLDLDHFKNVNDTLGHGIGDKLLRAVVERLKGLVRESDTIARMGGDEFAIVQVGLNKPSDASVLAQRVINVLSEPFEIDGHQVIIGTSIGIAIGPTDGVGPDQLMRNADLALYRAKADGRSTFRFFEPEMDARMQARRAMEFDLRKALHAGEFELHYQPLVNLMHNRISGFEALVRWRHPTRGMIAPAEFIPLSEEIGFIVPLGEWALRTACATAVNWPDDLRVSVNLSPVQFRNPGLVKVVLGALAASGLAAGRLELEITEAVLLEDNDATLAILYQLREIGVRIAMDDFGTGYSSLSYLQRFPFDKIKIDRSFIKELEDGPGALNIVRAVAALANGLGMATTAEGVETVQQLETVRAEGCTEIQGFIFSKPRPAHEIEELFVKQHREQARANSATAA